MKNGEEWCRNQSRMRFGSASTSCFLLLTNFTKMLSIYEAEPLTLAPSRLFIGNEGRRLNSRSPRQAVASTWSNLAHPGELVTSLLSFLGARGLKNASKWPFYPPFFGYFSYSFPKHRKTFSVAWKLVLSSSIRLARIQMLPNDIPRWN